MEAAAIKTNKMIQTHTHRLFGAPSNSGSECPGDIETSARGIPEEAKSVDGTGDLEGDICTSTHIFPHFRRRRWLCGYSTATTFGSRPHTGVVTKNTVDGEEEAFG
jgi:hypothetical protein